eukprot:m.149884 g.149884  ORF g.149884 m.149884 type:complete len:663 (-) comp30689_c0_seq1:127-2115(-)
MMLNNNVKQFSSVAFLAVLSLVGFCVFYTPARNRTSLITVVKDRARVNQNLNSSLDLENHASDVGVYQNTSARLQSNSVQHVRANSPDETGGSDAEAQSHPHYPHPFDFDIYVETAYFDPAKHYGFRPLDFGGRQAEFATGAPSAWEYNPSITTLPQAILEQLYENPSSQPENERARYVAVTRCTDAQCPIVRLTASGNRTTNNHCSGESEHLVFLNANYEVVATPKTDWNTHRVWQRYNGMMDLRLQTRGDKVYGFYLLAHPPQFCVMELVFWLRRSQVMVAVGNLLDPTTNIEMCLFASGRNLSPIWPTDQQHTQKPPSLISWLTQPFPHLRTFGMQHTSVAPPPLNVLQLKDQQVHDALAFVHNLEHSVDREREHRQTTQGNPQPPATLTSLTGVGDEPLHANGFVLPLPGGDALLTVGHVHTDASNSFKWGDTYINYFILYGARPPHRFLGQSPPFCFPSALNRSLCDSIQFIMTAVLLEPSLDAPKIQITYGVNDCGGALIDIPLHKILEFIKSEGSVPGTSESTIVAGYNGKGDKSIEAVEKCVGTSTMISEVLLSTHNSKTEKKWLCKCVEGTRCYGSGCVDLEQNADGDGGGTSFFEADCDDCACFKEYIACAVYACTCQGFSNHYKTSTAKEPTIPSKAKWFWEAHRCNTTYS